MKTIGVISDTHGLLRSEALAALQGSDYIIHAGDIEDPEILDRLKEIASVTAVRGNVDFGPWADQIPEMNVLEVEGVSIYVLHILDRLDLKPEAAGFAAVIYGHSHVPKQEMKNGVLYFNPGSAGPEAVQTAGFTWKVDRAKRADRSENPESRLSVLVPKPTP